MTRVVVLVLCAVFVASVVFAQGPAPGQPIGLAAGLQGSYNRIKGLVTASADKMSEADYGFKPTAEIRTYGQLWGHVANFHFGTCAQVKGAANPNQGNNLENTATTKAAVVKALAEHDNEMYGIGTVYLRLKGLVPPSTEQQQQRQGGLGRGRGN
jgi:hypothetical protein